MSKIHVNYITLVIFLLTCLQREQDPEKKYPHRVVLYIHTHKNPHVALFQIQNNRMKHLNVTTLDETSSEDVKQDDTILDLQHTSQQAPSSIISLDYCYKYCFLCSLLSVKISV
ncbi:hypothetical protein ACJX0J_030927, partial [Zea mays]